jgi:hypothetical protein
MDFSLLGPGYDWQEWRKAKRRYTHRHSEIRSTEAKPEILSPDVIYAMTIVAKVVIALVTIATMTAVLHQVILRQKIESPAPLSVGPSPPDPHLILGRSSQEAQTTKEVLTSCPWRYSLYGRRLYLKLQDAD